MQEAQAQPTPKKKAFAQQPVSRFHGPDKAWQPGKLKTVKEQHSGAHTYVETAEDAGNGKVYWAATDNPEIKIAAYPHPANN